MVEGGPTAIKRYKKLMLRRIQWTQSAVSVDADENLDSIKESSCG